MAKIINHAHTEPNDDNTYNLGSPTKRFAELHVIDGDFTTTMTIPVYASSPATGSAGDLYFNSTDKGLYSHDGTQWIAQTGSLGSYTTGHFVFTLQAGDSWDDVAVPVFQVHENTTIRITKVVAAVIGVSTPTLTFNLEERSKNQLNSTGTQILTSSLVATATGAETEDFADPSSDQTDYIVFTTSTSAQSGTVYSVTVTAYYERTS